MKILFVHISNRRQVQRDLEILRQHFDVEPIKLPWHKSPIFWIFQCFISYWRYKIHSKIKNWADIIYCDSALLHSLFPIKWAKRYQKKSLVIIKGFDACNINGFGMFSSWKGRQIVKSIYTNADLILPVDESLKRDILKNSGLDIENKIRVVPRGHDSNKFYPSGNKENMVLTVCYVNKISWWLKGLNTFVDAAKHFPTITFVVAGEIDDDMKEHIRYVPSNVTFIGWPSDKKVLEYYQRAKVYCQLSKYEGLPSALCEAMLCNCIPVGTPNCGIPHAIGDTGYYAPYGDVEATVNAIRKALNIEHNNKPRKRIKEKFPVEKREKELVEIVRDVWKSVD